MAHLSTRYFGPAQKKRVSWPVGEGEMARRIRAYSWAATPLGPIEDWPQCLRDAVDIMLGCGFSATVRWGPEGIFLYNDSYIKLAGNRHPAALGRPFLDTFPELRESYEPTLEAAMQGETVICKDTRHPYARRDVPEDAWFTISYSPIHDEAGKIVGIFGAGLETTDQITAERARDLHETRRAKAEKRLRRSEEQKAYLLKLSDALRAPLDPIQIQTAACRILGQRLGVSGAFYIEIEHEQDGDYWYIRQEYRTPEVPSLVGRYRPDDFGATLFDELRAGRTLAVSHIPTEPRLTNRERESYATLDAQAYVGVPLVKDGQLVAILGVHQIAPRVWTADEIATIEETAERTWAAVERARAESRLRESEDYHRASVELNPQIVWTSDAKGGITSVSSRWTDLTGLTVDETLGSGWLKAAHPNDLPSMGDDWRRSKATGEPYDVEVRIRQATGSYRWSRIRAHPRRDETGQIIQWFGTVEDEHDRHMAEEALRETEERQSFLLALGDATRNVTDPNRVIAISAEMVGRHFHLGRCGFGEVDEAEEFFTVESDWTNGVIPSFAGRIRMADFTPEVVKHFRRGEVVIVNDTLQDLRTKGNQAAYENVGQVRSDIVVPLIKDGRFGAAFYVHQAQPRDWTANDVTLIRDVAERIWAAVERARAEAKLRESEARLQLALEASSMGTFIWYPEGDQPEPDARMLALFGLTSKSDLTLANALATMIHPLDRDRYAQAVAQSIDPAGDGKLQEDIRVRWPDGSEHWLAINAQVQFTGDPPRGTRMAGMATDITDRKRSEAALRESEERFRLFLGNVLEYALVQTDLDLHITSWNPGAERMFGYNSKEIVGKHISLLLTPEDREAGILTDELATIAKNERYEVATWLIRKDGTRLWTRWVTEPIRDTAGEVRGLAKVLRDETERRRAEASMRQSEKLAVVGRLASSIAHEINNPLEAVTNLLYLAQSTDDLSPETRDYLDLAQKELSRVSHITTETLRFHRQASRPVSVDLAEILDSVLLLHEGRVQDAQITIERRYAPRPNINCLPNEIRQVLANLIGNAIDAMSKNTDARRLIVRIHAATDPCTSAPGVRLMVSDTGSGISRKAKIHIFEPFFTTKEMTGTGLGLWVSAEIVRKHKGSLRFRSTLSGPHRGTVFSLFLCKSWHR